MSLSNADDETARIRTDAPRLSTLLPELESLAVGAGALRLGISPLEDAQAARFAEWIDAGHQADMDYLRRNRAARLTPSTRFPWAQSVIVITVPYESNPPTGPADAISSRIARYAQGEDYHQVLDRILRRLEQHLEQAVPGIRTRRYVDTGPLSDRAYGSQAGLGWIGRNSMLIDPDHGSYVFLGILLTSLELDLEPVSITDLCGECTRCIDACPTDAILPGRFVDSLRCISYGTIERRGPMPEPIRSHLEGSLFGCDICQEVCPWNADPAPTHPSLSPREEYRRVSIRHLLRMQQDDFSRLFRRSAVKRTKRTGLIRNAILVADSISSEDLERLRDEQDPGIADAIRFRTHDGGVVIPKERLHRD